MSIKPTPSMAQIKEAAFVMLCTSEDVRPYYDNAFQLIFTGLRQHFAREVAKALAERGEIEAISVMNDCLKSQQERSE